MSIDKVAIVGGGWAGIACAVELADHGVPVVLYEAARQLGGRARTVDWNGLAIDNGQHLMIGAYRESLRLMARLGTTGKLERRSLQLRTPGFRLRLPPLPNPLHVGVGLLFARGLGLRDKYAAASFMRYLRAQQFKLPRDLPVAELLTQRLQPGNLIEKLWAPLCLAALNTPLQQASGQVFCNVLRDSLAGTRADSDLLFNRADLGSLLANAAETCLSQRQCEVRLGSPVKGITHSENRFMLAGPDRQARQLVLASHPARLPALLDALPEMANIAGMLADFTWQPIHTLWLRFAAAPRFPFPMLGLGGSQAPWAFERSDIAAGVVALVTSAEGPHLNLSAEQLRTEYLALLTQQIGPLPALLESKTIIEKRATYTCIPAMRRPQNRTPLAGLFLAGDFTAPADAGLTYPATLEAAVRSGVECARLIIADRT